jgi:GNAT superfamily N-acetyltransferase
MHFRMAVINDASSIAMVLRNAFAEYEEMYTPVAFAATTPGPDQILNRLQEGPIWVAVEDAEIVGTLSAVPKGEVLHLRSMAVVPIARSSGIGWTLLRYAERYALQHGFGLLTLSTTPFLTRAIHLYKSFGFVYGNDGPLDLFGTPLLVMIKVLN